MKEPSGAGFVADGTRYVLRQLHLLEGADSYLANDRMFLQIDHRGRCAARFIQPNSTPYSEGLRCFYLRDEATGQFWSAPFEPVRAEPESFEFSAGIADLQWRTARDGLEVTLRLAIPDDELLELWTVTVRNLSPARRRVSLYSFLPIGSLGGLSHEASFDRRLGGIVYRYFPYYVEVGDYFKLRELRNCVFCAADAPPTSFESNQNDFAGWGGLHHPEGLRRRKLGGGEARHEPGCAVFQFLRQLPPGGASTINLIFGPAKDRAEMRRLKRKFLAPGGPEKALKRLRRFEEAHRPEVRIDTPDAELNHFVNHWLPKQTRFCGRTMRLSRGACARNALQDAMGLTYHDPLTAREWFVRIFAQQDANGWLRHGLTFAEGVRLTPINFIPHRDMNVWGPPVLHFYLRETGDLDLLEEVIPFRDDPRGATLYEHLCRGLDWLLRDRTRRGLSRIGEGDWNDPLNMAGYQGKGESVWLTEALAHALEVWAEVAEHRQDRRRASRYRKEAERSRRAVNRHAWDGRWYCRGTTDAGRKFGGRKDREGKIYLNAQSWAVIGGVARGKRLASCLAAVNRYLATPSGPTLLFPAYTKMREDVGKITLKTPGLYENGSVYCHAAVFYAYALYMARRSEEAFQVLRGLLPGAGGNTLERAGQLPLYLPNFFRGPAAGKTAGRSSHHPGTGTCAWYYRTVIAMLLGLRGEFEGLRLDPQLPRGWQRASAWRKFRGAVFHVEIKKSRRARKTQVILDGQKLPDNLVPLQPPGTEHTVLVTVPG